MKFLSELPIKSSGLEARYGGATGGVASTVIRSGGNEFHRQTSLYLEHDSINAARRPAPRLDRLDDDHASYFHVNRQKLDPKNGCGVKNKYRMLNPRFALGGPHRQAQTLVFASYYLAQWRYEPPVYFLRKTFTNTYVRKDRQDWFTGKLD